MHRALFLCIPALAAPAVDPTQAALQKALDALVRDSGMPGASLAVILKDGRMLTLAAGVADRETAAPMTPQHRLFSGSIGKTYVAALVLRAAAAGQLGLDDLLSKHLGHEPWFQGLPNAATVTLRHLLTHTAGMPEYVEKEAVWKAIAAAPDKVWSPAERLAFILGDAPLFEAGKGFGYADSHYILLGMVLERLYGIPLETQERALLTELGLKETVISDRRDMLMLPTGYSSLPPMFHMPQKVVESGRYVFNPQLEWAGGGFASTAADLARWGAALYGGKVLSQPWLRRMVTSSGVTTDFPDGATYGLGAILWQSELGLAWGHSGFVPGFNAVLQHLPKQGVTLALLCNSDVALKGQGRTPHAAAQRLLRAVLPAPSSDSRLSGMR